MEHSFEKNGCPTLIFSRNERVKVSEKALQFTLGVVRVVNKYVMYADIAFKCADDSKNIKS